MPSFQSLFGDTLLSKDSNNQNAINRNQGQTVDLLKGKDYILLLFSAEYCPSCRVFLGKMNTFYKEYSAEEKMNFEVVFISSDETAEEFKDYYKVLQANWLALPYESVSRRTRLYKRYSVSSIPTAVILDGVTGKLVSRDACKMIEDRERISDFPWKPRDILDILNGVPILDKDGQVVSVVGSEGVERFALYFAAHWCPSSRAFTPLLDTAYYNIIERDPTTRFIYVSFDTSEEQYKEYCDQMPWCRLPFQHDCTSDLVAYLNINKLPALVTIKGKSGRVMSYNGVEAIADDEEGIHYPWAQVTLEPVAPLVSSEGVIDAIKSLPCVILVINSAPNRDVLIAEFTHAGNEVVKREMEKEKVTADDVMCDSEEDDPGLIDTSTFMNPLQFFIADSNIPLSIALLSTVTTIVHEQLPPPGTASVFSFHMKSNCKQGLLKSIVAKDIVMYTDAFLATLKKAKEVLRD